MTLTTKSYADNLTSAPDSIKLVNQTIDTSVSIGMVVYYAAGIWYPAIQQFGTGVYEGSNTVILFGICNLTNLIPTSYYYQSYTGTLTTSTSLAYSNIKVGFALSTTQLLVDIDIEGSDFSFLFSNGFAFSGGNRFATFSTSIDTVNIHSVANSTVFGTLTSARGASGTSSNGANNRAICAGGAPSGDWAARLTSSEYINTISASNGASFGALPIGVAYISSASNNINNRMVNNGGYLASNVLTNARSYFTMNTLSSAVTSGSIPVASASSNGTSNGTSNRGIMQGRYSSQPSNNYYYDIVSLGSAALFGISTIPNNAWSSPTSNLTNNRAVFAGGVNSTPFSTLSSVNNIDYITINTTGNATDFGDLTVSRNYAAAFSSGLRNRACFAGGAQNEDVLHNIIDYVTISTIGNAIDFGDLTRVASALPGCSNA